MKTSMIGRRLRAIRNEHDHRLADMAQALGVSASFLSAIETGSKSPPAGFPERVAQAYCLPPAALDRLEEAANASRKAFRITPKTQQAHDTTALLARKLDRLNPKTLEEIRRLLLEDEAG